MFYRWDIFRKPETLEQMIAFAGVYWQVEKAGAPYPHAASLFRMASLVWEVIPEQVLKDTPNEQKAEVLRAARLAYLQAHEGSCNRF